MTIDDSQENYSRKYPTSSRHHIAEIIDGALLLPANQTIGRDCKRNHGKDGKTVRHVKHSEVTPTNRGSGECVACSYERNLRKNRKKQRQENESVIKHKKAMDILEEKQYQEEDLW